MTESHKITEKLTQAYDRMMENLHALYEKASGESNNIQGMLEETRDKIAETDNLTREEAEKVSNWLKRDLQNAGEYLKSEQHELADWLHMDIELIEWSLMDMFLAVADPTKVALMKFEADVKANSEYHTGEITGAGTLTCVECGEVLHFKKSGHIPPCPKCNHTVYTRKSR